VNKKKAPGKKPGRSVVLAQESGTVDVFYLIFWTLSREKAGALAFTRAGVGGGDNAIMVPTCGNLRRVRKNL
jgi:hypothetical protein